MEISPDGRQPARSHARARRALGGLLLALVLTPGLLRGAREVQENSQAPAPKKHGPDYALIFVSVFGPDGRARYGVPLKVRRADQKKAAWEGYSDHAGEFAARVPVGPADYVVWADIKMSKGQPKPEGKVHIENDERADISLRVPN